MDRASARDGATTPRPCCPDCGGAMPAGRDRCRFCAAGLGTGVRRCPRCEVGLEAVDQGGVPIDRCARCAGEFYDLGEVERIHAIGPTARAWLFENAVPVVPAGGSPARAPLACCGCRKAMRALSVPFGEPLVIDLCAGCRGMWLDRGEGAKLYQAARDGMVEQFLAGPPPLPMPRRGVGMSRIRLGADPERPAPGLLDLLADGMLALLGKLAK